MTTPRDAAAGGGEEITATDQAPGDENEDAVEQAQRDADEATDS